METAPSVRHTSKLAPVPYHITAGAPLERRILLISYHAPPSNEVGALRWAGMARHLAEAGWGLDIIALDPGQLHTRNPESLAALPAGTRLFGVPDTPPPVDRLVQVLVRVRNRLRRSRGAADRRQAGAVLASEAGRGRPTGRMLLDAFHAWREYARGFRWARCAAAVGMRVYQPGVHQWVACTSPPHMAHEAGRRIAGRTGIPFLADFRDPWRFSEWVSLGPAWLELARRYEPRIIRQSALTVVNAEPVRPLMARAYPDASVIAIPNGVDDAPVPTLPDPNRFIIGYPGGIYLGRDPSDLVQALGGMVRSLHLSPQEISLEFMGYFDQATLERLSGLATQAGIADFLRVHPGASRDKAQEFMASCSVLVALQQGSDLAIPAKVFEYMRFPAWLMVIAGREGATTQLLEGTAAVVHEPGDVAGMQASLVAAYRRFRAEGRPAPLASDARFARATQTARLLAAMEDARKRHTVR